MIKKWLQLKLAAWPCSKKSWWMQAISALTYLPKTRWLPRYQSMQACRSHPCSSTQSTTLPSQCKWLTLEDPWAPLTSQRRPTVQLWTRSTCQARRPLKEALAQQVAVASLTRSETTERTTDTPESTDAACRGVANKDPRENDCRLNIGWSLGGHAEGGETERPRVGT